MKLYIFFIFFLIIPIASSSVIINEIMYNPSGADNNHEWLELYNKGDEEVDLSGWKFYEADSNHRLTLEQGNNMSILPQEHLVIVQDTETFLQDYENYTNKILDSSFSLSNDGELLIIKDSAENTFDSIIDILYYYSSQGADGNGMSLCKIDNEWQECIPTPGSENSNQVDYTKLIITEFMPNPIGNEDNEWVELYNLGDNAINLEGLILNDGYGEGMEISNVNIEKNNTIILPNTYLTINKNGNGKLTLSNDGFEKVQLFYENTLLDEISYSHTKEGLSWSKVNNNWILTLPTPNGENHIEEPDFSSKLTIDYVYLGSDDKARFGDSLRVRITVYKGDTSKYNLDMYLIDKNKNQVSKRSEINIEDRFTNYTLIIPLQINPNCNMKYNNGTYEVVLKGLDEFTTEEIEVEGITKSLCEIIKIKEVSTQKTTEPQKFQEIEQETTPITSSVTYQSSDIKARNIGIYFFCAVLILLIIYLIFKKNL